MNIFDKKLSETTAQQLPINPIELYTTCSYKEGFGYLRGIQEEVLSEWHKRRDEKDIICKMNTGSGKTLTGLLMLYSKLIETKLPSLYLCPDHQLVNQTVKLAGNYGIKVCEITNNNDLPLDFLNSKKILVCTFQKLFNGKSKFKREEVNIGALVIDDAHKCVDVARDQSSLKLQRKHPIAKALFRLFEDSLKYQMPGSYHRLANEDPTLAMKVPYWTLYDNQHKILELFTEYISKFPDEELEKNDGLIFKWPFIADNFLSYECYIGGSIIELRPIHVPYQLITPYHEATHRYILSATFEDDFDLIKDLGMSYQSVTNPIAAKDRKDIGKRLILAPERFDVTLDENKLRAFIASYSKQKLNVVVLVPSDATTKPWIQLGAEYVDKENIQASLEKLQNSTGNFMVFKNRYDGIDLHGDLCRVLVIDGLPQHQSLEEQYIETRMDTIKAGKKAQIIDQGLGRGVRSGADYCAVFLMGRDLIKFVGLDRNLAHFTPVSKAQLNLGLELLDGEETTNSLKTIEEVVSLCLTQAEGWINFHNVKVSGLALGEITAKKKQLLEWAEIEQRALVEFRNRKYVEAGDIILKEIAEAGKVTDKERAWYYQMAAQLMFLGNKVRSNDLQSAACTLTTQMFQPLEGHAYARLTHKGMQATLARLQIAEFNRPQDIIQYVNSLIDELRYIPEIDAVDFETKLAELGKFLGFTSDMPEKNSGNGPDVLWCMTDSHYLILEAKNRSIHGEISRENIQQLLHSETWFKNHYGEAANYTAVTLQSNRKKGKTVNIHDKIMVIDEESLELLKDNLSRYALALQNVVPKGHTDEEIGKLLNAHKFTSTLFRATYLKDIK